MSGRGKNTAADFSRRFRGLQPGLREKDDLPQPAQTSITVFQLGPEGTRNTCVTQKFLVGLIPSPYFAADSEIRLNNK